MEYKKSMIIIILAIFLFSIASVSASDADDATIASENNLEIDQAADNVIGAVEDTNLASSEENEILSADEQTFEKLNATINGNTDKDIYLNGNYKYSGGDDSFKDGIVINRDVNIYGNGSVIDGNKEARIFRINSGNVVFYNITFVNGNAGYEWKDYGGAINGNCKAINCTFIANHAHGGGAMYGGSAVNCNFTANTATYDGGAMYGGSTVNCSFSKNIAERQGGAMYGGSAVNCTFSENAAYRGGAMYGGSAVNCSFSGNTAGDMGGAMYGDYKMNCTGQIPSDYHFTYDLVLHWDANNFTTSYGSADELPIQLMGQGWNLLIDFINYDVVIYKDGSKVKTYHCLSNDKLSIDLLPGVYTAELIVTYPGIDKPEPKNITLTIIEADESTFWYLNNLINNNTNDTITLDRNYTFNSTFDPAFSEGIIINRNVTINGNGYTIDAKGKARVFDVQAGNVTIENLTIKNANYDGNGGAIYFGNSGSRVINCNFTANTATCDGGAVYFQNTGTVSNCNFTGNTATGTNSRGGAVYFNIDGDVRNCNFTANTATYGGGAVYFLDQGTVTNCNFTDNKGTGYYSYGGAICMSSGSVTNCNFTNNAASLYGGAVYIWNNGNVLNCNFTANTATYEGGAINIGSGTVSNCNFTDNEAYNGGAIRFNGEGNVTNCNFTNNKATGTDSWGGAIRMSSGTVTNCNFTNNKASGTDSWGGAILMSSGSVSNCNFTGNNATAGSAIYFSTSATKTVSNSRFLNNRANAEALEITKNDNNITITFTGRNNLLNAIYSMDNAEVTFNNVTYWGKNGITTISTTKSGFNKEEGQNITVGVVVNDKLVLSEVMVTDENGQIVLDIITGNNYYIGVRHDTDSYYTEAERTISNNTKFNVNVTSQTTHNRTVNITAKSNIPNDVVKGKLLFILPNSEEISANYGGNGTWWAVHKFDDYGVYEVNASYTGLDNVTVNNGTITINKPDSTIMLDDITLNYGESKNVTVTTTGATEITASINGTDVTVINNYTIPISGLAAGNYTLNVTTVPDGDHNSVSKEVKIIVYKVTAEITVDSATMDIKVLDEVLSGATLTPADAGNLTYKSNNETVVIVKDGKIKALAKGTATITVSFAGNENYTATKNKTISVTVTLKDAIISVNNSTLNLFVDDNFTVVASTNPDGLNVTFVQDDSGVYIVDENGNITALREGTGNILVKVGGDGVYAENSTTVAVTVSKIPTEITLTNETLDLKVNDMVDGLANLTPADAGNLTFISSDENVVFVADGKILARSKGNANVTVSFAGNDKYAAALNRTIHVNVSLNDASVSVENDTLELKVDERYDLNATAVPSFLNVEYVSSNESVATVTDYGIVTAVGEGTTVITLTVGNDMTYAVNTTNVTVTVSKIPTEITVDTTPLDLFVGDEIVIVANLTPAGAGNVTFTSSDYDVVDFDFEGNVIAQGKGQAIITVSFAGDDKYAAAENKTIIINVSLDNASVTVDNNTLDLKVGETSAINATKHPDTIMLDITYTSSNSSVATVDKKGIVATVGEGTAIITVEVGDDEIYAKNSTTVTVTVSKIPTEITLTNTTLDLKVGDEVKINVTLTPSEAGELDYISSDVSVVTVNGIGELTAVGEGTANITVRFLGDDKYKAASKNTTVNVAKDSTKLTAENVTATYKVDKYLTITLTDSKGNPLANIPVTVDLNGVKNYTTDENGQVKVKVSNLIPKTYTAKISFAGNDNYLGSDAAANVVVKKATPKITAKAKTFKTTTKTKKYTITLKDNDGKAIKKGTVYLKVGGKTYKATTNSKGKATFKITKLNNKGTYKATVTYKGNKYYNKATKKVTIKVKSVWKTVSKGSKNSAIVKKIQRALKNHGYYLEYNGHYLLVDGIFWDYTQMAVKEFQNDKYLKVTGKVDEKTARKLGII